MPKILLTVHHQTQHSDGDCLATCAAIILDYLNRPLDYPQLLKLLKIKPFGAPASNIRQLEQFGLTVTYRVTDIAGLESMLAQDHPIIVFVRTGELPYWEHSTDHALVVVGFDDANIYVNDPNFQEAPITISRGDFELAWLERDYYYALVTD